LKKALLTLFEESGKKKVRFEQHEYLYERGQALINWMKEHLKSNPIPSDERIAIVFHSQMIKAMTATGLAPDEKGNPPGVLTLQNGYMPANCEVLPFNL
jgi:hypothetical protein